MTRAITVAAVQAPPLAAAGLPVFGRADTVSEFAADVRAVRSNIAGPALLVYPELHLFGTEDRPSADRNGLLREAAGPMESEFVSRLGEIARDADAWLVPGSVCELGSGGELFNTALVFSPHGDLIGTYRKVFPWRPTEPYTPGDRFVTVDVADIGRIGLSICYDAWFPEAGRHLAWMGADVIVNVVKTTTPDRAQEVVLARANSIVNQVFTVSVNCAGPVGMGRSLIVDPEGAVLQESADAAPSVHYQPLDLGHVDRVRRFGTAGTIRMWSQFRATDVPLALPLYAGRIDPNDWTPSRYRVDPTSGTR